MVATSPTHSVVCCFTVISAAILHKRALSFMHGVHYSGQICKHHFKPRVLKYSKPTVGCLLNLYCTAV